MSCLGRGRRKLHPLLLLSVLLVYSAVGLAAPETKPVADTPAWLKRPTLKQGGQPTRAQGLSPWRVVAVAMVFVGLGLFVVAARRRRQGAPISYDAAKIRVLSSARIGPKAQAVVATVGGRALLLGVTDHNVRRLAWLDETIKTEAVNLDEPEAEPALRAPASGGRASGAKPALPQAKKGPFTDFLRSALGRREALPAASQIAESTDDVVLALSRARQRLKTAPIEGQAAGLAARLQGR